MPNTIFQSVVGSSKRYNNFNLSREVLVSGQIGKLIPVQCDEVVPGDRYKETAAFLMRFAPLSAPAMARFNVHFHTFYVPYRIITPETSRDSTYEKFVKSIGKHQDDVPVLPFIHSDSTGDVSDTPYFNVGSLADYLGFPVGIAELPIEDRISALPFLCYQRIYQDFYRRDQIEKEVMYPADVHDIDITANEWTSGEFDELEENQVEATIADLFKLQTRNYERDYFTSALPSPQFGDEVSIGDGNINWMAVNESMPFNIMNIALKDTGIPVNEDNVAPKIALYDIRTSSGYFLGAQESDTFPSPWNAYGTLNDTQVNRMGENIASHLQGNAITINEFRLAMQLQGIKEKINRVGTRYLEIMQGIYDVRVPDARLQRPIYLGGFKNPLTIGSVMQTSESDTTPQGTLTGQMSGAGTNNLVRGGYEFKEHGYIMTIMSVTPRTSYYGGMPKKFMKKYPEDFYLPDFDHLGEQEISKSELFYNGTGDTRHDVFGYTPRYAEYKSAFSTVHGEFRTTLDNWHVARDFDQAPSLNPSFIKAEPEDFSRIFEFENIENTSNEHFYCQVYLEVIAKRNMSKYSTPYTLY